MNRGAANKNIFSRNNKLLNNNNNKLVVKKIISIFFCTRKIEFKKQYVAMAGIIYTINNDFILLSNNIFGIINTKLLLIIIKL